MGLLSKNNCLVLLIDIQEKLLKAVKDKKLVENATKLVHAANTFGIPVFVTEQYPQGLGETDDALEESFSDDTKIVEKNSFSALREPGVYELIKTYNKRQIIICGIEAHICVHQTAADLIAEKFEVFFIPEASASRTEFEFYNGVERMKSYGVQVLSLEMALFELLESAKSPFFKDIQQLIK